MSAWSSHDLGVEAPMTDAVARLLAPLTRDQQALVDAVFEALTSYNVWPSAQYLERQLEIPALNPLLASLPTIGPVPVRYSVVWHIHTAGAHGGGGEAGLTVAGLAHVDGGERLVEPFLAMLRCVAQRLKELPNRPTEVSKLSMTFRDLADCVRRGPGDARLEDVEAVIRLIPHEPATWHGTRSGSREDWIWSDVPFHITGFGRVETVEQYLEQLDVLCGPTVVPAARSEPALVPDVPQAWTALLHPGLRAHLAGLLDGKRWSTAVREAAAYLEHDLRRRGGFDSSLVGLDLLREAMRPTLGPLAMPPSGPVAEQEGWYALARGFFGAVRNPFTHGLPEVTERMAAGAIYTASLLLVALDEYFPGPG